MPVPSEHRRTQFLSRALFTNALLVALVAMLAATARHALAMENLVAESVMLPRKLLVIAPHPDDETLGVGGVITRAISQGATVSLVVLTDGDGCRDSAMLLSQSTLPEAHRSMAEVRRYEASRAATELGIPVQNVHMLGFPDGYLMQLWKHTFSGTSRFSSPRTLRDRTPAGLVYNGSALLLEMSRIVSQLAPTEVYVSDPHDLHPDHSAAFHFTLLSLGALNRMPVIYTYRIHGQRGLPMASRVVIRQTPDEMGRKRAALREYVTQMTVAGQLLSGFIAVPEERFFVPDLPRPSASEAWFRTTGGSGSITCSIDRESETLLVYLSAGGRTYGASVEGRLYMLLAFDTTQEGSDTGASVTDLIRVDLAYDLGSKQYRASIPLDSTGLRTMERVRQGMVVFSVDLPKGMPVIPPVAIRVR